MLIQYLMKSPKPTHSYLNFCSISISIRNDPVTSFLGMMFYLFQNPKAKVLSITLSDMLTIRGGDEMEQWGCVKIF